MSKARAVATPMLVVLSVAAVLGGALVLRSFLIQKPQSCSQMIDSASSSTAAAVPKVDIIVGLAGNTPGVASEAAAFVERSLRAASPETRTIATITLVDGARQYRPTTRDGTCIGRPLLVSPSATDLRSYQEASAAARDDVAKALERQYQAAVRRIAQAVERAMQYAPAPPSRGASVMDVWPFVEQGSPDVTTYVLDAFATGGNSCLTMQNPTSLTAGGSSSAAVRVEQCAGSHLLARAPQRQLHLQAVASLNLTGAQAEAQSAVLAAMCRYASINGCR